MYVSHTVTDPLAPAVKVKAAVPCPVLMLPFVTVQARFVAPSGAVAVLADAAQTFIGICSPTGASQTMKLVGDVAGPAVLVTLIGPLVAPAGTVALTCVLLSKRNPVPAVPLN